MKSRKDVLRLREKLIMSLRKADIYFNLLRDDPSFVAGISGGFDSLVMLDLLHHYKEKYKLNFEIFAVFIDNGIKHLKYPEKLENYVIKRGFTFHILHDCETKKNILLREKPFNPCFICSRNRKRIFIDFASSHKAKRILIAHNLDDIIETLFLNMFYSREISTMLPSQPLFKGKYFISRPLSLVDRSFILKYASLNGISEKYEDTCPYESVNKRKLTQEFLKNLYQLDPQIHKNLKHTLFNCNSDFLWGRYKNIKEALFRPRLNERS